MGCGLLGGSVVLERDIILYEISKSSHSRELRNVMYRVPWWSFLLVNHLLKGLSTGYLLSYKSPGVAPASSKSHFPLGK